MYVGPSQTRLKCVEPGLQILNLVLQSVNVPFCVIDVKSLCKSRVSVGGSTVDVQNERDEAGAKFANMKGGARLEVGAVGLDGAMTLPHSSIPRRQTRARAGIQ